MSRPRRNYLALFLLASVCIAILSAVLVFSGVLPPFLRTQIDDSQYEPPALAFEFQKFSELENWRAGDQASALPAFLASCDRLEPMHDDASANSLEALGSDLEGASLAGTVGDWRPACGAARMLSGQTFTDESARQDAARSFFERHFRPIRILGVRRPKPEAIAGGTRALVSDEGLFTGYYEPVYEASLTPTAKFSAPALARPGDLVMVDLGAFRQELAGQRIAGYVEDGRLIPYADHQSINDGALGDGARPIAWLDPNDLFFMQVQGSGRLHFPNGAEMRLGYDGQNGHPYAAIGRTLVERGAMRLEEASMQSIRAWLEAAEPGAAREVRETNPSYVFFREIVDLPDPSLGPLGAQGVQLTAGRSLAVDRRFHALGAPVWVAIPASGDTPAMTRLFIAQDTGGAIRGPVRGDIFFGAGQEAGELAGRFRAEGKMSVLLPTSVAARLAMAKALAEK